MPSQQKSEMDVPAYHRPAPVQVVRNARGVILGRIERQGLTGRSVARDAQGLLAAVYDPREGLTRDRRGLVVARGDVLAAYLFRP